MKIAIMGTHGTGKTTMAYRLATEEKQKNPAVEVRVLGEIARECPYPLNMAATKRGQDWILLEQLQRENVMEDRCNMLICDRTVLDTCAYSHNLEILSPGQFALAIEHFKTYRLVYWLRPNGVITPDGVRDTSPAFQTAIDNILAGWIEEYGLNVIEIKKVQTTCGDTDGMVRRATV